MSKHLKYTYGIKPFEGMYHPEYSFKSWTEDVEIQTKHYYQNQRYFKGIKKENTIPQGVTITIVGLFALVAFLYSFHRKRFILLLRTFFNWKIAKQVIRYEKVYSHPVNVILFIVFLVASALFYAIAYQKSNYSSLNIFYATSAIMVIALFYLLIKLFLYKSSAWLFQLDDAIEEYIFQSNFFNKFFGLINLFLIVLLLFSPLNTQIIITISIVSFLIFLVIQLIRGILIGLQNTIPIHLIILYLCSLEILPWILIGKWIKNIL